MTHGTPSLQAVDGLGLLKALLDNFQAQSRCYARLLACAERQNRHLGMMPIEPGSGQNPERPAAEPAADPVTSWTGELDVVLAEKAELIRQLDELNRHNGDIRAELARRLGLARLTLTDLEQRADTPLFATAGGAYPRGDWRRRARSAAISGQAIVRQIRETTQQLTPIMEKLQKIEADNEALIRAHLARVRGGLGSVSKAKDTARAYGKASTVPAMPRFLDKKR